MTTHSPLPEWVQSIFPHQAYAVKKIMEAFETTDVVFLEAPTGSGKTLIAELVRRELGVDQALYVCNNKHLQDQFLKDFQYAKVLKGRSNYRTQHDMDKTCDDCMIVHPGDACWYCDDKGSCPYEVAKGAALASEIAVVNGAYFLAESNFVGSFTDKGESPIQLVVVDEADTAESQLMGFVEYRIPKHILNLVKMTPPKKGTRKPKLVSWLGELRDAVSEYVNVHKDNMDPKERRRLNIFAVETATIAAEIQKEIDLGGDDGDDDEKGYWLRIYEEGQYGSPFVMKPVLVNQYGQRYMWRHGEKWLIMSASIISAEEMADSLGITDWALVTVPMTFPEEHRPIIYAPVASMSYKAMKESTATQDMINAIKRIVDQYPDERILIHSVSYGLTKSIVEGLKMQTGPRRRIFYHYNADDREATVAQFTRTEGSILISPSMGRGADFKGDLCRVVIIAKVPFPSLADRTISARLNLPGGSGQAWYAVQTIREIVQMTGRGVRNKDDWAITFILDGQFSSLFRQNKHYFPDWWKEALKMKEDVRWILGMPNATVPNYVPEGVTNAS